MTLRRMLIMLAVVGMLLSAAVPLLAQGTTTHVVQPGETLFRIALRYGLTVEQLAAANGITNPAQIFAGQVLVIPQRGGSGSGPGAAPTPAPGGSASGARTYTVQAGDTLFSIARRNNTTVDTLVRLNGLSNANVLFVGQVLILSSGSPPPTQAPTQAPASTTPAAPSTTQAPGPVTHVVQRGETLSQIALRYGTTYQQIALLSGLSNPDIIYPGQTLIIRQDSNPPTQQPTAGPTTAPTTVPTSQPTAPPGTAVTTAAPVITPTVRPSATPTATATASPPPAGSPTPTPIVPDVTIPDNAPNRFTNPGFEGSTRPVVFGEINVFEGWEPFYCDQPYTPEKCPAPRQGSGNPPGLMMGRPEYKPTDIANRVRRGETAQQWFCFWRTCRAGVFQTIDTTPGAVCETGAYVQSWSANGTGYTSDLQTADQRANSTWFIRVDQSGGSNAFAEGVLVSRGFGYADGIYDRYVKISYIFRATGSRTTIFFDNLRLWPIANNDNYIDEAYVRCTE